MSFDKREGVIWYDGELVPWEQANTHVLTHTLHYAMGGFEGIRAYPGDRGPIIFRLHDHLQRLLQTAHILQMPLSYSMEQLSEATKNVIAANKLTAAYIRPMFFYGSEAMGLHAKNLRVHMIIAAWRWDNFMGKKVSDVGIKVNTSSFTRHHGHSTLSKAKANGHYMYSMLALHEATNNGAEEALMLDVNGFIAEGTAANIFIVKKGKLLTPDLSACLEGITRDTVLQLALARGLAVAERNISRDELYTAEEAFFCGTAMEIVPIIEVDKRIIASGKPGPITIGLQKDYFELVHGRLDGYQQWLEN